MTQEDTQSVSLGSAKQLSITTVTKPQLEFLTPRYLLRALEWIDVPTGTYRVNKVKVALSSRPNIELKLDEQGKPIISADLMLVIQLLKRDIRQAYKPYLNLLLKRLIGFLKKIKRPKHYPPLVHI